MVKGLELGGSSSSPSSEIETIVLILQMLGTNTSWQHALHKADKDLLWVCSLRWKNFQQPGLVRVLSRLKFALFVGSFLFDILGDLELKQFEKYIFRGFKCLYNMFWNNFRGQNFADDWVPRFEPSKPY